MVKLGEVCSIERGGSPRPIKDYITDSQEGLNWIKIGDTDPQGKYIYRTNEKIKPEGLKKTKWVEENDLLLSNSMSYGRPYILKTNGCIHDGWLVIRDYQSSLNTDFFYYLLLSPIVQRQFLLKAQGSTVSNLNTQRVTDVNVLVPPLEEQHRIVSILDASFEKIDALKKNAEENLKNAKALFQQVLAQELKPKEGWGKYELENICTNIIDCPHSTPKKSDAITNYPCIRTSELRNGKIYWDSMQYLDKDEYEKRVVRLIPKEGDIVYGREGTFGDAVLLPSGYNFSLGQRTMLLRPDTTIVYPEFLLITMISPYVYKQAKDKNSGCGVGHVNVKDIKKFTIYLPDDISEQHRIVRTLDTLSEKCSRLEQIAQQTICECDALKQSILRQAFSGNYKKGR